jgi:hypothetical protein
MYINETIQKTEYKKIQNTVNAGKYIYIYILPRHPKVTKTPTHYRNTHTFTKVPTCKFEPLHSMEAYKRSGGVAPLIMNPASLVFESPGLDKMSDENKQKITNKRTRKG